MKNGEKATCFIWIVLICVFFSLCTAFGNTSESQEASVKIGLSMETGRKTAYDMIEESGATEWDYVAMGDSVVQDFVLLYAIKVEEDLGIRINIHNWTKGGDSSSDLLQRLKNNTELRKDLAEAELITIEVPWGVVADPCRIYEGQLTGDCGGKDNQDCLRRGFGLYMSDTEKIFEEIVSICDPSEVLIRTMDTYQVQVGYSKRIGTFETINKYWREANTHLRKVANQYNIPVVNVYDAFMGETGTEDPGEKGLLYDGFHKTKEGLGLMTDLFLELGYAYSQNE